MKITIEATNQLVIVEGRQCRRWHGVTEQGIECDVFIQAIRVRADADCSEFEHAMKEIPYPDLPPIDLRFLS